MTRLDVVFDTGADATAAAGKVGDVDAVVLVVGLTSEAVSDGDEAEGHDRTSLLLPSGTYGNQEELITEVGAAASLAGKPVVVVVMGGGPVDITFARDSADVGAIVWCGYPGQSGGTAIADAIFGVTNRWGKLTQTWYPESFAQEVALTDMNMRPDLSVGSPGRSHRFYTGTPVFSFGTGLSYTAFTYVLSPNCRADVGLITGDLLRKPLRHDAMTVAEVAVTVNNVGQRAGDAVFMLLLAPPADVRGRNGAPLQSLVGFDRAHLVPGSANTFNILLSSMDFSYALPNGTRVTVEGDWQVWVPGSAAATLTVLPSSAMFQV